MYCMLYTVEKTHLCYIKKEEQYFFLSRNNALVVINIFLTAFLNIFFCNAVIWGQCNDTCFQILIICKYTRGEEKKTLVYLYNCRELF